MTLTPAVFREAIGKLRDDERVLIDEGGNIILAVAVVDGNGSHAGTTNNPLHVQGGSNLLAEMLTEMKITNTYLQLILGEKITEKDIGG